MKMFREVLVAACVLGAVATLLVGAPADACALGILAVLFQLRGMHYARSS